MAREFFIDHENFSDLDNRRKLLEGKIVTWIRLDMDVEDDFVFCIWNIYSLIKKSFMKIRCRYRYLICIDDNNSLLRCWFDIGFKDDFWWKFILQRNIFNFWKLCHILLFLFVNFIELFEDSIIDTK